MKFNLSALFGGGAGMSPKVQEKLEVDFRVGPGLIAQLRSVQRYGHYGSRKVTFLRLYDPAKVPGGEKAIKSFNALNDHQDAILFEGYIEKDGAVKLTDRRRASPVDEYAKSPTTSRA